MLPLPDLQSVDGCFIRWSRSQKKLLIQWEQPTIDWGLQQQVPDLGSKLTRGPLANFSWFSLSEEFLLLGLKPLSYLLAFEAILILFWADWDPKALIAFYCSESCLLRPSNAKTEVRRNASSRDCVPSFAEVSSTPARPSLLARLTASSNCTWRFSWAKSTLFPTRRMFWAVCDGEFWM